MAPYLIGGVLAVTTVLWALGRMEVGWTADLLPWRAAAQLTALWLLATTSLALAVGTRARALEPLFGGVDAAVRLHRRLGSAALLLLAAHVVLLLPPRWPDAIGEVLDPSRPDNPFAVDIVLTATLVALATALPWRRVPHRAWLWAHRSMAALLLLGCAHSLTVSETVRAYEPLRSWMVLLVAMGGLALAYRLLLFRHLGPRHGYRVLAVERRGAGVTDLVLRPAERRMTFDPGAFVYLSVRGSPALSREMHPFSLASSPTERDLRLSVAALGDWTSRVAEIQPGTRVDVFGPFGSFTPNLLVAERRLILIGAGIGITPFLSMLRFELANNDFRRVWLHYLVRRQEDAVHHGEILSLVDLADSWIDYGLWLSSERGRLTAHLAAAEASEVGSYAVMLCGGNAFIRDMRRQFRDLGVPARRIIAEEFDIR